MDDRIKRYIEKASRDAYRRMQETLEMQDESAHESPIEHLFSLALCSQAEEEDIDDVSFSTQVEHESAGRTYRVDVAFYAGHWLAMLAHVVRPDLFGNEADIPLGLYVELDGHDFHERTKAQARRDKSRDRAMAADGVTVLRFTGSEVWRDPDACAKETLSIARNKASELFDRIVGAPNR